MPPTSLLDEDGNLILSQTLIETFRTCPEKFRRIYVTGEVADPPGPEAMRGILAHAGIEAFLSGHTDAETIMAALECAIEAEVMRGAELPPDMIHETVMAMHLWLHGYANTDKMPRHFDIKPEVGFSFVPVPGVRLQGHVDAALYHKDTGTVAGCLDWKLSESAKYHDPKQSYEKARYNSQPTSYLWGLATLHNVPIEQLTFQYVAIGREQVTLINVYRTQGDVENLIEEMLAILRMYDRYGPDDPWPRKPDTYWCSPLWCPVFERYECQGKVVPHWITAIANKPGKDKETYARWLDNHPTRRR